MAASYWHSLGGAKAGKNALPLAVKSRRRDSAPFRRRLRQLGIVMKTFSKLLRGKLLHDSCAIATSGALILANFSALAQDLQPGGAAPPLPPAAAEQQPMPPQQPPQQAAERLGQGQLEKLLAPIALYPDDLVAQIMTAATYPIEVVQAARWVNEHKNVHGDALQDAMAQQPWDASVKGLTAVPQVLAMMNDKLDWTQQLGEAFLAQPDDVSNAVQQLRAKAQANGNLQSSDKIKVSRVAPPAPPPPLPPPPADVDPALLPPPWPADYIMIEPVDPGIYYVPIYDPYVVYGPWGWPAYAPFYWYPPGYVVGAAVIGFSVGFFVGSALWCHYNWGWHGGGWRGGGPVTINVARFNQFNRTNLVAGQGGFNHWQFDAAHRGTVGFQNAALRQQFGGTNLKGTANLNANTNFKGNPNFQGNPNFKGNPNFQGNPNFKGNPNLKGNPNFNSNANANRNLNVNANVNRNLNVNGNPNVNRNLNVNGNPNVNRNLNVNRNVNVNTNNNVNRNQNAIRNQNVNRNLNVNRNFNAGNVNRGGGNVAKNAGQQGGNKQQHH
jgi:Fe2+ transport system protein FeoA